MEETADKKLSQSSMTNKPNEAVNRRMIQRRIKQSNFEETERKRRKALYGTRASSKIFDSPAITSRRTYGSGVNKTGVEMDTKVPSKSCKDRIIISQTSKWKAIFDVVILILVGYSCVTSMLYVAFKNPDDPTLNAIDGVVEFMFWLDLLLNFIQSYKHPESLVIVTDLKSIARNYVFKGWFVIDFVSVFPFTLFMSTGQITKLFRLFRLPRLIKLIDISKFQKVLQSLMSN